MSKKPYLLLFLYLLTGITGCSLPSGFVFLTGGALGTTYAITFKKPSGSAPHFVQQVEKTIAGSFEQINNSLSIYNYHSLISGINNNTSQETDSLFRTVFNKAVEIAACTDGAFDISAAPFFDLWGFGLEKKASVTPQTLEEIRQFTGMDKFLLEGTKLLKKDPRSSLSMNAIAKGFACDFIANELQALGITDLLVEIGGEVMCRGLNPHKQPWKIGIDSPVDGNVHPGKDIYVTLRLTDKGLATSGNYRNYYEENGEKFAHIINPKTGTPVNHNLLSATVVAEDCMTADAYATAFMVMGLEATIAFLEDHPELGAYLIYGQEQTFRTYATDNILIDL